MNVGDLVIYRHDRSNSKTLGLVLWVTKKYINSGKPERAHVYWTDPDLGSHQIDHDWIEDLEIVQWKLVI